MKTIEDIKREVTRYVFDVNVPTHSRSDFCLYLKQYVDYLHAQGLLMVWQPIETAPRDGTRIIVYRPNYDGDYIPKVGYDYWGEYQFKPKGCWMKSREDTQPTAWMPFPRVEKDGE